jgi:hypothetical protein
MGKHDKASFKLRFDASLIPALASRYDFRDDTDSLTNTGNQIREGRYTRKNLETIFEWKTRGRGRSRLAISTAMTLAHRLRRLSVYAPTQATGSSDQKVK